jgi:hypothetical protein
MKQLLLILTLVVCTAYAQTVTLPLTSMSQCVKPYCTAITSLKSITMALARAEKEVFLMAASVPYLEIAESLDNALKRGVKVYLLVNLTTLQYPQHYSVALMRRGAVVHVSPNNGIVGGIAYVDRKTMVISELLTSPTIKKPLQNLIISSEQPLFDITVGQYLNTVSLLPKINQYLK